MSTIQFPADWIAAWTAPVTAWMNEVELASMEAVLEAVLEAMRSRAVLEPVRAETASAARIELSAVVDESESTWAWIAPSSV